LVDYGQTESVLGRAYRRRLSVVSVSRGRHAPRRG